MPGPRSRALLQSGVEGLAPGEKLPEDAPAARAGQDGLAAAAARAALKQDLVSADLDSDDESVADAPQQPQVLTRTFASCAPGLSCVSLRIACTLCDLQYQCPFPAPCPSLAQRMARPFARDALTGLGVHPLPAERAQRLDDAYSGWRGRAGGPHALARRPDQGGRLPRPRRVALPGAAHCQMPFKT